MHGAYTRVNVLQTLAASLRGQPVCVCVYCVNSGLMVPPNVFKDVNQANLESQPWTSFASDEPEAQNSQSTQGKSCLHEPLLNANEPTDPLHSSICVLRFW